MITAKIALVLLLYLLIGSFLYPIINYITIYKTTPTIKQMLLIITTWPICLLIIKKLKKLRKIKYYKEKLIDLETIKMIGYEFDENEPSYLKKSNITEIDKEIINIKRILKLNKLK